MAEDVRNDGRRIGKVRRTTVLGAAAALMLLPVLAMRAVGETASDPSDFAFLFVLLVGVGLAYEVAARASGRKARRVAVGIALAGGGLLTWINLAVGIIGNEGHRANLMYGGVLAVAAAGALAARFRPDGMVRAMVAAAIAQALVFVIALIGGLGFTGPITVFFCALWLTSAWSFRKAARERTPLDAAP